MNYRGNGRLLNAYCFMEKLKNILIIDDDPMTNYLHKRLLEKFEVSHEVEIAHGGEEALQRIKNNIESRNEDRIPQLIFVDLDMPLMDGFQFLEAYQNLNFKNKDSVVVSVLTSSFSASDIKRVKEYPIVKDYIVKPLTQEKMIEIMEQHFDWHDKNDRMAS